MTRLLTPTTDSVNVTNNTDALAALKEIQECKVVETAAIAAKTRRNELEESVIRPLLASTESHKFVVSGVVVLTMSAPIARTTIDAKTLLAAFPEAHAATARVSHHNRFKYS